MTQKDAPSSDDDGLQEAGAPESGINGADEASEPWWANNAVLERKRREVEEWIESLESEDAEPTGRGASHEEIQREVATGECRRELRDARQELDRARVRYADAIRAARAVGYSWGEIGQQLGVPRQLLHRRYRYEVN